jgi:ABC-2 type transport system permease protein
MFSGFESVSNLNLWSTQVIIIKQFGIQYHYESLGRGLVDSRDLVYFLSASAFFLLITKTIIGSRSW